METTSDALERMEMRQAQNCVTSGILRGQDYQAAIAGRRMFARGEEDRGALQSVLSALNGGLSIEALERAVATVKAHLEASA